MPRPVRGSLIALLALALPVAGGTATPVAHADSRVTGTASYRERVALAPDAVFEAELQDVSRGDAPARVIGRARKSNPGQVPIAFEISYDPRRIDAAGRYAVRATIHQGGRLRFTSDRSYPVLTQGHGSVVTILMRGAPAGEGEPGGAREPGGAADPVERASPLGTLPATFAGLLPCADCMGIRYQINLLPGGAYMQRTTYLRDGHDASYYELGAWSLSNEGRTLTLESGRKGGASWAVKDARTLRKLDLEGRPIESKLPYELARRATAEPMEPRVRLRGEFRYMADAARFRDCRSGLALPVAMSGDEYLALERAYTVRRAKPGDELMVSLAGRIEEQPRMEGDGTEPTLVVEEFVDATPGEKCAGRVTDYGIENNRWRPVRIGEHAVNVADGEREPWIVLDPRTKRVTGSGGCNRINGTYEAGAGTLRFGPLAATMMSCLSMETESAFLRALQEVRRYRLSGRTLDLLDDRGRRLVRLEERNLR